MKKLFLALVVCAGFCACSNDDVVVTSNPGDYSREAAAYLTVNIKDVNSGTRATDGGYAYGTTAEQTVNNAYFYFYDKDGNYMANGAVTGGVSGTASEADPATNVEWNSNTLVAVYGLEAPTTENPLPTQMLTVLNKPTSVNLERQSLTAALATLAGTPYGDTTNGFVMSTSAYMSGENLIYTTALTADNFAIEPINLAGDYKSYTDETGTVTGTGESTVVNVYVERLAAKVGVKVGMTEPQYYSDNIYPASETLLNNFPMGLPEINTNTQAYAIKLLGFDVDGVARDAYLVKNIASDWEANWPSNTSWNAANDYRCYWAMSPNYGVEQEYPITSKGNYADDEATASTWLNDYLQYVDLKSPATLGTGYVYCGENTNTVGTNGVIDAADNSGLTNVLVKAQFGVHDNNYTGTLTPVDLVEFHGEYYTAADFRQKCVDDVVNYDFTVLVDEVIAALKTKYNGTLDTYLDQLNNAVIHDHIYKTLATVETPGENDISAFGGEMLSLYNDVDGYVKIYYNMTTQPKWGNASEGYTNIDNTLYEKYPESKIVYGGYDLDDYDFWFHVDEEAFESGAEWTLQLSGLLKQIGDAYYMPIDNSISFTTEAMGDDNDTGFTGGHTYTTRNFLLRTITVEADGIDSEFGSHEPNFFKEGLMYYHVPIEHLGVAQDDSLGEGQYGVVRNHWYDITITSLEGLGRGIADENEVIVPLPEVEYYYLGADINILSWKMVNQSVGF